jgi:hypothetical protein
MLDFLIIVLASIGAVLLAYRAMTLNSAGEADAGPDAENPDPPAKPRWASGRRRNSWRTRP